MPRKRPQRSQSKATGASWPPPPQAGPLPQVRAVQTLEVRAKEVPMRVIEAELDAAVPRAA